jgi:hypothetical protein
VEGSLIKLKTMQHLFPYKQTKNKAFFKEGNKEAVVTIKGYNVVQSGDKFRNTTLHIPLKETVHLDRYNLTYKK